MLSKMLVLATVPIHGASLANKHFYGMLLGRREGVCKKSTLCTLAKMLNIMDGPQCWLVDDCPHVVSALLFIALI